MLKWKANLAQDSDGLYTAQQMINQLTQGLPLANESTVQLADTHLDENSDWSKINYNEYYLFDSLMGLNAPDKQSLIYDRGLTIKVGDSNEFIQLAITQGGIGVKYNNTNWSYLLNGSGGSGTLGNYVIDNKDGTVYFNGVTVTLATSKDVQSLTNLINLKQDKLTYNPADDTKVVHTTDMRKPASEVASIDEVNNKQDAIGYAPANDTQVVHKTGDEEIADQKTFDNAPIDKTTNSPYATNSYVSNAINTAVSPLNTNTNWTSLSVDSSQTSNDDWDSNNTNFQYRICNSALYLTGQYAMLGNSDSSHNSTTLFQLSSDITSKISFPSTNKFPIGILQQLSQQATMDMISLTSDGKIVCAISPYELHTNGATLAAGYISATIPLNY